MIFINYYIYTKIFKTVKIPVDDLKKLEFLAEKSKELIEKQVSSYRQQHSYAGTIIGITSLFIPFFISGLSDSYKAIQLISLLPITLFIWSTLIMLSNLMSRPLDQAFSVNKYQELVNKPYKDVILYEIGANTCSYRDNKIITQKANKKYNFGVILAIAGIIISIILLLTNNFFKPDKDIKPIKVEHINSNQMKAENNEPIPATPSSTPIVIPTVPPSDRERMNEGVDRPQIPTPSNPDSDGK